MNGLTKKTIYDEDLRRKKKQGMSDSNSNRFPAKNHLKKKPKRSTGKSRETLARNTSDDVKSLNQQEIMAVDDDLSLKYSWSHSSGQTGAPIDSSVGSGGGVLPGCTRIDSQVKISLNTVTKSEARVLKRKLQEELDRVRSLIKRIETDQNRIGGGYNNHRTELEVNSEVDLPCSQPSRRTTIATAQKRNQKPNQPNKKSDIKKLESGNGWDRGRDRCGGGIGLVKGSPLFKSCNNLLTKFLKDQYGWIFKEPVDAKKLELFDYFDIIKNPMDLGTVKTRLNKNWYKSPQEFAEDVRLTFSNALLYNSEGQDTHTIAKRFSNTFEEKWVAIEAEYKLNTTTLEDEEEEAIDDDYNDEIDYPDSRTTPSSKCDVSWKPSNKGVTQEEKAMLVERLESLPMDALETVGQIMLNRNPELITQDGEIELDVENVDPETHWEIDTFVTNYRRNMIAAQNDSPETNLISAVVDGSTPRTGGAGKIASPVQMETGTQVIDGNGSDTSSDSSDSSSSDSDSSSSDSDSDSDSTSKSNDCSADTNSIISI